MNNRFSILFYPKRKGKSKNGKTSIYLRVTVNGKRCEISINRKVDPAKWNSISGKLNGNSEEAYQLNK